jgi:hypothetical protein
MPVSVVVAGRSAPRVEDPARARAGTARPRGGR